MNILATQYSLETRSLEIYLAGCRGPHCPGCHNPASWDFDLGYPYDSSGAFLVIKNKVAANSALIENIMVMGGEPLDQDPESLLKFSKLLNTLGKRLWLFTREPLSNVPPQLLPLYDRIKCGRYDPAQLSSHHVQYGVKLASDNQRVYAHGVDY